MGTVPPELSETQDDRPTDTAPHVPPTMREPGAAPAPQVGERRPSTSPAEVVIAKVANGTLSLEAPRLKPVGATMLSMPDPLAPRPAGDGPPTLVTGRAPEPGQVPPPRPRPAETQLAGPIAPIPLGWSPAARARPPGSKAPLVAAVLGIGCALLVGGALAAAVLSSRKPSPETQTGSEPPVATAPTETVAAADTPAIVPAPALPTASVSPPPRTRTTTTAPAPVPTPVPQPGAAATEPAACRVYRDHASKANASQAVLKTLAAKCKAAGGNVEQGF